MTRKKNRAGRKRARKLAGAMVENSSNVSPALPNAALVDAVEEGLFKFESLILYIAKRTAMPMAILKLCYL